MTAKQRQLEERLIDRLRIAVPLLVVATCIGVGLVFGPGVGVLVLAAGAIIGSVTSFWSSIRALFGETALSGEDAFALGAPSTEEEQKRAILRAIKDLEFEHGVGKISDEDYLVLTTKYRAEAKRLLRVIDDLATPERNKVEKMVAAHLAEQGLKAAEEAAAEEEAAEEEADEEEAEGDARVSNPFDEDEDEDDDDEDDDAEAEAEDEPFLCDACEAANDLDAVFCKKCGARLDGEADEDEDEEDGDDEEDDEEEA